MLSSPPNLRDDLAELFVQASVAGLLLRKMTRDN
jgi:hypothetical protein